MTDPPWREILHSESSTPSPPPDAWQRLQVAITKRQHRRTGWLVGATCTTLVLIGVPILAMTTDGGGSESRLASSAPTTQTERVGDWNSLFMVQLLTVEGAPRSQRVSFSYEGAKDSDCAGYAGFAAKYLNDRVEITVFEGTKVPKGHICLPGARPQQHTITLDQPINDRPVVWSGRVGPYPVTPFTEEMYKDDQGGVAGK